MKFIWVLGLDFVPVHFVVDGYALTEYDGLGFDYKWDMGWMNDTLAYFKTYSGETTVKLKKGIANM